MRARTPDGRFVHCIPGQCFAGVRGRLGALRDRPIAPGGGWTLLAPRLPVAPGSHLNRDVLPVGLLCRVEAIRLTRR